jgi:hypothetical protein
MLASSAPMKTILSFNNMGCLVAYACLTSLSLLQPQKHS